MAVEKSCCGTNATFFAQITAIFGIIFSSGLILFSQFFTKHHSTIPGIVSLLIYTFVLYGINKQKTAYLVPALAILVRIW
uniref:Uncharacterized protein n=1 Tax=Panagrolaimus sp. PS1159 TaxID=55785 RepID=A0AC35GID9_9BILA